MLVKLSEPLNIGKRLELAITDEHDFHVIYYNRKEGATFEAIRLAKEHKNVAIVGHPVYRKEFAKQGIRFFSYYASIPDGLSNMKFIMDCIPEIKLNQWKAVHGCWNKIVALKCIKETDLDWSI